MLRKMDVRSVLLNQESLFMADGGQWIYLHLGKRLV